MKMKFALFVILIALTGTLNAQVLDKPVAIVQLEETENIGQRELRSQVEMIEAQLQTSLTREQRMEVLDASIAEVLIMQAAERDGITVSRAEIDQGIAQQRQSLDQQVNESQFREIIESQVGMSWDQYVEQVERRLTQEKYVLQKKRSLFENVAQPSEREIRRVYEDNATDFNNPAMVRFDHLFWDTRNTTSAERREKRNHAEELYRELRNGSSTFDDMMDRSVDDSQFRGDDFGYLLRTDRRNRAQLGPGFVDSLFELEQGQVSRVLESNVGYHIARVRDRRSAKLLELDDPLLPGQSMTVRRQIVNYLLMEKQQKTFEQALREIIDELREDADITIFDENLSW
jgi:peptidyl-prolyl cis-trans isomerase SurA